MARKLPSHVHLLHGCPTQCFKFLHNWNFREKCSRALDAHGVDEILRAKFACKGSLYVGVEVIHVC